MLGEAKKCCRSGALMPVTKMLLFQRFRNAHTPTKILKRVVKHQINPEVRMAFSLMNYWILRAECTQTVVQSEMRFVFNTSMTSRNGPIKSNFSHLQIHATSNVTSCMIRDKETRPYLFVQNCDKKNSANEMMDFCDPIFSRIICQQFVTQVFFYCSAWLTPIYTLKYRFLKTLAR